MDLKSQTQRQKVFGRLLTIALIVGAAWAVGGERALDGDFSGLLITAGVLVVPMLPATWVIANLAWLAVFAAGAAVVRFNEWLGESEGDGG